MDSKYKPNWHHEIIADAIERALDSVKKGNRARVILELPPRHGKSRLATELAPSWLLAQDPSMPIIVASHTAQLAEKFGLKTKIALTSENFKRLFPHVTLRKDSKAKANWMTEQGGQYIGVGVGGPITGMGAKFAVVDDPIKNREEAESPVYRDKVWDWFTSTLYTRLEGPGAIVVIMCMTGDTKVLMADGSEKELKDIRIGDEVATYKEGKLCKSKVKNWRNNGRDSIFTITTSSGKIVRANERHPFLVYQDNKLLWKRVKNLHTAQKIVILKDNGVNGKAKSVQLKDVTKMQNVEDTVIPTIIKRDGLMDTEHNPIIKNLLERGVLNTGMELLWKSIKRCLNIKKDSVQYVKNLPVKMSELIGEVNFALTIAMKQARLGVSCATIATSLLDILKMRKPLKPLSNTSDFTLDEIVSIEKSGIEEVFDLQVEETENFIANGLVSHNTRWHTDDLVGRLLTKQEEDEKAGKKHYDKWEVIKFPAIAEEDEEFRKIGEPLWKEKFKINDLETIKNLNIYDWHSLYQQDPIHSATQEFRKEMFKTYSKEDIKDLYLSYYTFVDPAISVKQGADNSVVLTVAKEVYGPRWFRIREDAGRFTPDKVVNLVFAHQAEYKSQVFVETIAYQEALKYSIQEEQRKREKYFTINEIKPRGNKELRIRGLLPLYANGVIHHLPTDFEYERELLEFPRSKHDDRADVMSFGLVAVENTKNRNKVKVVKKKIVGYFQ